MHCQSYQVRRDFFLDFALVFYIVFRILLSKTPEFEYMYVCKKRLSLFSSPAGMSLTKRSLAGNNLNYYRPGRVWLGTSWLGTGNSVTFFTVYICKQSTYFKVCVGCTRRTEHTVGYLFFTGRNPSFRQSNVVVNLSAHVRGS